MSRRPRFLALLLAFGVVAGLGASAPGAATSALTLEYTESGILTVITAAGTTFRATTTPGPVISPGQYQVIFNNDMPDSRDIQHQFRFQGPGVNLQTDLGAGDNKTELFDVVLAPSSTYVFVDDRQPNLARVVVSTASSASAGGSSSGGTSGGSSTGTSSNSSIVGSDLKPAVFRGNLAGSVGVTGKLTLTAGGTKIARILSGRYKITVDDRTAKLGFTMQRIRKPAITLTGLSFVGKRTVTVDLKAGQWVFYSPSGKKTYFTVLN
jgi:hypothetical protein